VKIGKRKLKVNLFCFSVNKIDFCYLNFQLKEIDAMRYLAREFTYRYKWRKDGVLLSGAEAEKKTILKDKSETAKPKEHRRPQNPPIQFHHPFHIGDKH
jgi:hypothetical protein